MGASTLSSMEWDARDADVERSFNKLTSYNARKWVKVVLPLNEWVAAAGAPALAAQGSGLPLSWTIDSTTNHSITTLIDLPNDLDRCQPLKFQALFSMNDAEKDPDIEIKYTNLAKGDDHAAAATALSTTIPVATDGAAGDDDMLRETYVGEITGSTIEDDEEMLVLTLKVTDDDTTSNSYELWSVRYWYQRLLL